MSNIDKKSDPIVPSDFLPVKSLLEQQIQERLYPGAQLCVAIDGDVIADFGVGETVTGSGVELTNDSIMPLFSNNSRAENTLIRKKDNPTRIALVAVALDYGDLP